ncbi:MAG: sugar transferase [Clostridia bacterium]|nr:sugar transferase [Clostridia bacterium]MBQ4338226.1 sugar transferase [Clostridia bacterium]
MKENKKYNDYSKSIALRMCKFVHIIITLITYSACLYYYNVQYNNGGVGHRRFMLFVALYAAILCFSLRTYKSYDFGLESVAKLVYSQSLANVIAGGAFYIVFVIANSTVFTPLPLIMLLVVQLLFNVVWSFAVNRTYFKFNKPKKTALIYNDENELLRLREVYSRKQNFEIVKIIKTDDNNEYLTEEIKDCEAVFVADISSDVRNEVLKYCIQNGKRFYTAPHIGDIMMKGATHLDMFSVPVFYVSRAEPKAEYAFIKRVIDIVCSLIGIIILSPIMIVTAIAIKAYDKGPAFYKQVRLTRNGKEFEIFKFRSMRVNAESDGVARLAGENDDRITPVGKIIRACRIDELPQLFNILKGDMTIVGPRPERPEIAKQYEEELPEFALRLQVKAGLTGLAQIYGRYNTEPYDKLQMDLMYINQMSFVKDLRLILATIKILFMKDSTQGTAEGQITAMLKTREKAEESEVVSK